MRSLVIAMPSRGLIHSRTVEAINASVEVAASRARTATRWSHSHDLPIPDSHNHVVREALRMSPDLIWMLEEDVIPEPNTLACLIDAIDSPRADASFCDYPIIVQGSEDNQNCCYGFDGKLGFCGTGCFLVRRETFERIKDPWFECESTYLITADGEWIESKSGGIRYEYGGHDVSFGMRMNALGMRIAYVRPSQSLCGHARVVRMGEPLTNHGCHEVTVHRKIGRWFMPRTER
jgi:hypothetical protein